MDWASSEDLLATSQYGDGVMEGAGAEAREQSGGDTGSKGDSGIRLAQLIK